MNPAILYYVRLTRNDLGTESWNATRGKGRDPFWQLLYLLSGVERGTLTVLDDVEPVVIGWPYAIRYRIARGIKFVNTYRVVGIDFMFRSRMVRSMALAAIVKYNTKHQFRTGNNHD